MKAKIEMKNILKNFILAIVVLFVLGWLSKIFIFNHSLYWDRHNKYLWIFKDSILNQFDTIHSLSLERRQDNIVLFHYKQKPITIWEFKDFIDVNIDKVILNERQNLENIKFNFGEVLFKKSALEIIPKSFFNFRDSMYVDLDENSELLGSFEGKNYKYFYGNMNKIALCGLNKEPQIILKYMKGSTPSLLLFYKKQEKFYLILFESKEDIDLNIIQILNLK